MNINLNKEQKRTRQQKIAEYSIGAIAVAVAIGILATAMVSSPKDPVGKGIPVKEGFAAIFRQLKADKVCYEPSRNTYLIHFREDTGEQWAKQWFIIKHPEFHYIPANKTWFLESIPRENYTLIWPNVEGLECSEDPDPYPEV